MMHSPLFLLCLLLPQQVPPNATGDPLDWDLIRIAALEAQRTRGLFTTRIARVLLSVADAKPGSREANAAIEEIAGMGPDAVPILLDVVADTERITGNDRHGVYAVRALVRLFQLSKSEEPLRLTLELLAKGKPMAQRAVLSGLSGLRHPLLLEAVPPFLDQDDRFLRLAAIDVLSSQDSAAAAGLLRPLLMSRPDDAEFVIPALQLLGDAQSAGPVAALLQNSQDQAVLAAAVSFLAPLGDADALPVLQGVLTEEDQGRVISMPVRDGALQAVKAIGLRSQGRFRDRAEKILVDSWRNTSSIHLRNQAQLALGPYDNEDAFDDFEEKYKKDVRANKQNAKVHLDFADKQIIFEKWNEALRTLNKAADDDDKSALSSQIAELRAVAYCGLTRYDKAEKELRLLGSIRSTLPARYEVVQRMANNPKYAELFQQ